MSVSNHLSGYQKALFSKNFQARAFVSFLKEAINDASIDKFRILNEQFITMQERYQFKAPLVETFLKNKIEKKDLEETKFLGLKILQARPNSLFVFTREI